MVARNKQRALSSPAVHSDLQAVVSQRTAPRVYLNLLVTIASDLRSQAGVESPNAIDHKADVVKLGQCKARRRAPKGSRKRRRTEV